MDSINMKIQLRDLIRESFLKGDNRGAFGRNKKAWLKEADKVIHWFDQYYGGRKDERLSKCDEILNTSADMILKNKEEFTHDILAGIRGLTKDKFTNIMRVEHLLKYMNYRYSFRFDLGVFSYIKWKDKEERWLMILKYLHSGRKNREQIAEAFGISTRTLDDDIATLKDGFEFMGTQMMVKEENDKGAYTSPIHPIFLALNSAEIYALTVGLKLLSKDTVFEHALKRISDHVYQQLSDFAGNMVNVLPESIETGFGIEQRKYINSLELMSQFDKPFCQFLKERKPCKVTYREDGEVRSVIGTLGLSEDVVDRFKKVVVYTEESKLLLDVKNIHKVENI